MSVINLQQPVAVPQTQQAAARKVLRRHCLYAVFASDDEARRAEQACMAAGAWPQRLLGPWKRGLVGRIERFFMRFGEDLIGMQRYALHAESGRVVLAVPAADRSAAMQFHQLLAHHGAYDVAYFRNWTVEYVGPRDQEKEDLVAAADMTAAGQEPAQ